MQVDLVSLSRTQRSERTSPGYGGERGNQSGMPTEPTITPLPLEQQANFGSLNSTEKMQLLAQLNLTEDQIEQVLNIMKTRQRPPASWMTGLASSSKSEERLLSLIQELEAGFPPKDQIVLLALAGLDHQGDTMKRHTANKPPGDAILYFLTHSDLQRLVSVQRESQIKLDNEKHVRQTAALIEQQSQASCEKIGMLPNVRPKTGSFLR